MTLVAEHGKRALRIGSSISRSLGANGLVGLRKQPGSQIDPARGRAGISANDGAAPNALHQDLAHE